MKLLLSVLFACVLLDPLTIASPRPYQHALQDADSNTTSTTTNSKQELFEELDELARIVDISYCIGYSGIHEPFTCAKWCEDFPDFELVTTWNTGPLFSDSTGYIALSHSPSSKRILVAFRGTYSLANTIADITVLPQPYEPYLDGSSCANCTVHAGFLRSWHDAREEILPVLDQLVVEYPEYKVVLVGHSLGGAVAALGGLELAERGVPVQVTTFGEPRVGNGALAAHANRTFRLNDSDNHDHQSGKVVVAATYRRVTHVGDPIPLHPLTEWGYLPHAGEIFISKSNVPPTADDLHICTGNADPTCSAGGDSTLEATEMESVREELRKRTTAAAKREVLSSKIERMPGTPGLIEALSRHGITTCSGTSENIIGHSKEQQHQDQDDSALAAIKAAIPSRLKLWELFFAHRAYFHTLGLCAEKDGWFGKWDVKGV